jgi:hypothetical protein
LISRGFISSDEGEEEQAEEAEPREWSDVL